MGCVVTDDELHVLRKRPCKGWNEWHEVYGYFRATVFSFRSLEEGKIMKMGRRFRLNLMTIDHAKR